MERNTLTLRRQTIEDDDIFILHLPAIFTGTVDECNTYANEHGYRFKPMQDWLFNGYFVHTTSGEVLLPT